LQSVRAWPVAAFFSVAQQFNAAVLIDNWPAFDQSILPGGIERKAGVREVNKVLP
jgi:hypothetical protein